MKKLTIGSFKRIGAPGSFGHYFSFKDNKYDPSSILESLKNWFSSKLEELRKGK